MKSTREAVSLLRSNTNCYHQKIGPSSYSCKSWLDSKSMTPFVSYHLQIMSIVLFAYGALTRTNVSETVVNEQQWQTSYKSIRNL